MKFVFCLLLLMLIELSIAAKEAKEAKGAEETKTGTNKLTAFFKGIWKKVLSPCSGEPKVEEGSKTSNVKYSCPTKIHIYNPHFDHKIVLDAGYHLSIALDLERKILEIVKVKELFESHIKDSGSSNAFDRQLKWNFNAIIGLQLPVRLNILQTPEIKKCLGKAMEAWREYLEIITRETSERTQEELSRMKFSSTVSEEIATYVSNQMDPRIGQDKIESLSQFIGYEIVMELLLTTLPKKQRVLFVELLDYSKSGDLDSVYNNIEKIKETIEAYKPNSQDKNVMDPNMFTNYWDSLNAGYSLSQNLQLKKQFLKNDEKFGKLIPPSIILEMNPKLDWLLHSVIGIGIAISWNNKNLDSHQQSVFDASVNLWENENFGPSRQFPSTKIEYTSEKLHDILREESSKSKSAIEEITEDVSKEKQINLKVSEKKELYPFLEFKISLDLLLLSIPKEEGNLLKRVFTYLEKLEYLNSQITIALTEKPITEYKKFIQLSSLPSV